MKAYEMSLSIRSDTEFSILYNYFSFLLTLFHLFAPSLSLVCILFSLHRVFEFSFLSLSRFIRQKQFCTCSDGIVVDDAIVVSFTSPRIYRVHFFRYDVALVRRGRGVKKMLSKERKHICGNIGCLDGTHYGDIDVDERRSIIFWLWLHVCKRDGLRFEIASRHL